jgi:hypothetical protein
MWFLLGFSWLVVCIRVGSNADPNPAFLPQCGSGSKEQTNTDPDPSQTLPSVKVKFLFEKYHYSIIDL